MSTKNDNMFEIVKFKWIKKDTYAIIISVIVSLFIILFLPKKLAIGFKFIIYISIVLILYMIIRYCISNNKERFNNIEYFNDINNQLQYVAKHGNYVDLMNAMTLLNSYCRIYLVFFY